MHASELWRGLTAGQWSVVRNAEYGAQRVLLARRGPTAGPAALSKRERAVVIGVVHGRGNKMIARRLGVAVTTVASHVRSVVDKLGFDTRAQLIATEQQLRRHTGHTRRSAPTIAHCTWWRVGLDEVASLTVGLDPPRWPRDLSPGEEQICRSLVRGLSVSDIADVRGTTVGTVANQLSGLYRRYGVSGRAAFIVAILDRAHSG